MDDFYILPSPHPAFVTTVVISSADNKMPNMEEQTAAMTNRSLRTIRTVGLFYPCQEHTYDIRH